MCSCVLYILCFFSTLSMTCQYFFSSYFFWIQKFSTQFSLAKMVKLIEKLSPRQRDSVIKCGFGSILALKCTSIPNSLILWTAKNYDPKSRHFKAAGGTVGVLSKLMQSLCTKFLVFHMEENKCPINHPAMPKCHPQRYKSTESSCKDWCFSWYDNSRAGRW